MKKYLVAFVSLLLVLSNVVNAVVNYIWFFNYSEDIGGYSNVSLCLYWLNSSLIILSCLLFILIVLFCVEVDFKNKALNITLIILIVANLFFSFIATNWIHSQIVSEGCDAFLAKSDMQKIYDEKIQNIFADLQKQDSRFKSISLKPLEGRLIYCPGKEILVIKYDGTMNDVMQLKGPSYKVEQKVYSILGRWEYDFSTSDKPGGRYQLFK